VRERAARGEVTLEYCSTEKMVADGLTKVAGAEKVRWLATKRCAYICVRHDRVGVLSMHLCMGDHILRGIHRRGLNK
jgi:hypothetical protein